MEPRSYMFLLPQREKVFDNLKHWSKPDCYIVDLQDGCPRSLLKTARANIIKYADDLRSLDTRILLRTNGFNDPKEFTLSTPKRGSSTYFRVWEQIPCS